MPRKLSVGIMLFRVCNGEPQILIVHPGGPLWARRDEGAWSIPKGEVDPAIEDPELLRREARREFEEETGQTLSGGEEFSLTPIRLSSGKWVHAWAVEGELDASAVRSNEFTMEWPPRSGREKSFPEVDRGAWVSPSDARRKLNRAQVAFLDELIHLLRHRGGVSL